LDNPRYLRQGIDVTVLKTPLIDWREVRVHLSCAVETIFSSVTHAMAKVPISITSNIGPCGLGTLRDGPVERNLKAVIDETAEPGEQMKPFLVLVASGTTSRPSGGVVTASVDEGVDLVTGGSCVEGFDTVFVAAILARV
jgi:hypothetical protein